MKTLTAVLFAGGESRRMGSDKATLALNGEPLWSRQIRILRELHPEQVMISARSKPVWCPKDAEVVLDEPLSRGPLSGLAAALGKIQTTHLFALAVDLPGMTSAHMKKLWALAQPGVGIIPQNDGPIEPLCAIYPVEGASLARIALSKEDVSLGGFILHLAAQNRVCFYGVTQAESLLYQNVNTRGDWQRATA
ncbi:MAG TPA: molybdenum cofactor guanylyltransferase [Verrucomicrobiae bacterium]|jgi:molybdopterin-guanine dinucleotide biosynthesis protein A|nr:molybdenum cofactor guanylyltransferase [Verrucomicrobiae bacterium]